MYSMRNRNVVHWWDSRILGIAENRIIPIGGPQAGYNKVGADIACTEPLDWFAFHIYTDAAIIFQVEAGHEVASLSPWLQLWGLAGPAFHLTAYDLAPPYNRAGRVTLCIPFLRLRVINDTGAVVDPFYINAKAWSE